MSKIKKAEGDLGENIATDFLKKIKYKIISRNYRLRNGEIDIVAIDNSEKEKVLVFIEVKTRKSYQFGTPFEAIGYYKLKALTNAAQVYKISHRDLPDQLRIDAIAVMLDQFNKVTSIEHLKSITS